MLVSAKAIWSMSWPRAHTPAWKVDVVALAAAGGMSKHAALASVQSLGARLSLCQQRWSELGWRCSDTLLLPTAPGGVTNCHVGGDDGQPVT